MTKPINKDEFFSENQPQAAAYPLTILTADAQDQNVSTKITFNGFTFHSGKNQGFHHGKIVIEYIPKLYLLELDSLHEYLMHFKKQCVYYEKIINLIYFQIMEQCSPKKLKVYCSFIHEDQFTVEYTKESSW